MSASLKTPFDLSGKKVWVAGHRGMVGSAIVRRLAEEQDCTVLTVDRQTLDLTRQAEVEAWLAAHKPDAVVVAAAKVGGIHANNSYPVDFLYANLAIEQNLIHGSYLAGVEKLLFLGSSCIYPRLADQPMVEEALLTGPLEPTNQWYAVAKIAGIKLCQAYRKQYGCDFISAMPTNLYGPGDNYHPENSHVPAATIDKCHKAKLARQSEIEVWGTGAPLREFMMVDDCADACVHMLKTYSDEGHLNVGTGEEVSIKTFVETVAQVVGFQGALAFNTEKPDGAPRKLMDSAKLRALGWTPRHSLTEGLGVSYQWYLDHIAELRSA